MLGKSRGPNPRGGALPGPTRVADVNSGHGCDDGKKE